MISTKPYLIRAIREWALDNGLTPQILVDANGEQVEVPDAYVKEGQIVLNIHDRAVHDLLMDNDRVSFSARFGGTPMSVDVPVGAIMAIFARENGQGIFFQQDGTDVPPDGNGSGSTSEKAGAAKRKNPPHLKLVQ